MREHLSNPCRRFHPLLPALPGLRVLLFSCRDLRIAEHLFLIFFYFAGVTEVFFGPSRLQARRALYLWHRSQLFFGWGQRKPLSSSNLEKLSFALARSSERLDFETVFFSFIKSFNQGQNKEYHCYCQAAEGENCSPAGESRPARRDTQVSCGAGARYGQGRCQA